jgi:hypothetical protein|tara:strand:+ start:203 stop:493 length:291 start_codon:yes stop_codon:yes gene_type:complete
MGFEDVTRGQGSFVSRTKSIDKPNSFTAEYEVAASTTYEPTGSFQNSAFIVEAGTSYNLSLKDGGNLTAGLVTGQLYPIALKKVVNGGGTVVKLLK